MYLVELLNLNNNNKTFTKCFYDKWQKDKFVKKCSYSKKLKVIGVLCYVMDELKDMKFNTKSIMITDKQKDTISDLIDLLIDMDCDDYSDLRYWELSKRDASKLISEMLDKIEYLEYIDENY